MANHKLGLEIKEAALGYCLNADMQQLSAFLAIGTYVPPQLNANVDALTGDDQESVSVE